MAKDVKVVAEAALMANGSVLERIVAAGPQGQYRAVGSTLARIVAKKAECSEHAATWALVNAAAKLSLEQSEEVNEDF